MQIGETLAHYTIVRALGSGGMGDVFAADDAKLKRQIALKVLPADMAASVERLERFRREAQAVAALNHPNIVTVHSVEEEAGVHFITMELVEGRTLDTFIPDGGMAIDTFFKIAIPMADAVAAAHERGIVHRDLKPANVMVTADDRVKVLDFGLAKLLEAPTPDDTATALVGEHLTEEGKILGTVAYMSPEQAEGRTLDLRTDIFSLGVVFYEMATGQRPFAGDTRLSVMSAIVRDTPALVTERNAGLPRHLGRIIRKALEKTPGRRYQTALDLRNDLEELKHEIDTGEILVSGSSVSDPELLRPPAPAPERGRWMLAVAVVAVVLVGAAGLGWGLGWFGAGRATPPAIAVTALTTTGNAFAPTVSPDGQWMAYTSTTEAGEANIFLQSLGDQTSIQLTRDLGPVFFPTFSPDGATIAFASASAPGGIFVMGRTGGNVRRLTERGYNPSWSPDGSRIVFGREAVNGNPYARNGRVRGLSIVDVATETVTDLDIGDAVEPAWSPDGERIAFWAMTESSDRDIFTVAIDGSDRVPVTNDMHVDASPAWSPDGEWLYFSSTRGGPMAIWRVAMDARAGQPRGEPQPITAGGLTEPSHFSLSNDGRQLIYQEVLVQSEIATADFDAAALRVGDNPRTILRSSRWLADLGVSPDGQSLAYRTLDARQDIYVIRVDGSQERQVTNDLAKDWRPSWSPDSSRLAFYSNASGHYQIWTVDRDGTRRLRLTDAPVGAVTYDPIWSPDGQEIIFLEGSFNGSGTYIVKADVPFDQQAPRLVPRMGEGDDAPRFRASDWSAITDRIVGRSVVDGTVTLYSPATDTFEALGHRGNDPRWLSDGQGVYYQRAGFWFAVDIATRTERTVTLPERVPEFRLSPDSARAYWLSFRVQSDIWMLEIR